MNFLFPLGLLMLVPVALMAAAYVSALRRRDRYASLPMLDKVIRNVRSGAGICPPDCCC